MRPDDLIEELEEEDHPSSLSSLPTMPFSSFHRSSPEIRVGPGSRVGERIEKKYSCFFVCCADSHVRKSQGSCFYGTWPAISLCSRPTRSQHLIVTKPFYDPRKRISPSSEIVLYCA